MSFPTFGLEVCILVIPDEPRRLCKDIEFMVKRLLKSQSVLIMHRVKTESIYIFSNIDEKQLKTSQNSVQIGSQISPLCHACERF